MAKITTLLVDSYREELEEAIAKIDAKYGVVTELGTIRYSETNFKATLSAKDQDGEFALFCRSFGLREIAYNLWFEDIDGGYFKVTGFNQSAPKFPIEVTLSDTNDGSTPARKVRFTRAALRNRMFLIPAEYKVNDQREIHSI